MPMTNTTLRGEGYLLAAVATLECCGGSGRVLYGELGEPSVLFLQEHTLWCTCSTAPLDGYLSIPQVMEILQRAHRASSRPSD